MAFFQNVFDSEFQGNLLLSDRQYSITFKVKGNSPNSSTLMRAWNPAPFDLSGGGNLTFNYSFDAGRTWTPLVVDVSAGAASAGAVTALEVVTALNANPTFAALFVASLVDDGKGNLNYVQVKSLRPREKFKLYISNTGAEAKLRFNKKAGVAELPAYFARHTIANISTYPDSVGMLIALNTGNAIDQNIITEAGFDYNSPKADWELLRGRSGLFMFQKQTVDGSDRVTQIIEFPAGALPGDLAKKTTMTYTGTNKSPNQIAEVPYVLTNSDLITP